MKSNRFNRSNLYKSLRLFLFITFVSITLILVFTVSKETKEELQLISPIFIGFTILSTFLSFFFNIWRLRYIIKAMGKELSWIGAFYYTLGGAFLGGITPLQLGGIPLQLYICRREDITIPEGSAAIFTRGLLSAFVLPFLIPFIYYYRVYFTSGIIQGIVKYLSILYGLISVLFIFILLRTEWITNRFSNKLFEGIIEFKEVFRKEFVKRKRAFLKAYGLTWLSLIFHFLIAFLLLRGLGIDVDFFKVTILQIVLTYALTFMPTPGASGFAEGSAYGLFRGLVPKSALGVYIVLWRFFTGYLAMIVGGIVLSKLFGEVKIKERKSSKYNKDFIMKEK